MPKLLSGQVLRTGDSGQFISLPNAQPALGASPSTSTGFTIITTPAGITSYSNILGNITFAEGSLTNYVPNQNVSINGVGSSTFTVNLPTVFNQSVVFANTFSFVDVTATGKVQFVGGFNSTGTSNGTLVVQGGIGVSEDVFIGGLLNVASAFEVNGPVYLNPEAANVSIQPTIGGTVTIKPDVAGDIDNMDIGSIVPRSGKFTTLEATGSLLVSSSTPSTSTTTGALVVTGGVGIGRDLRALRVFDNNVRVISTINTGAGLSGGGTGPTLTLTNTGVLSLTAATGTFVSSTTGNITIWTLGNTLQAVTEQGNTTNQQVYFNNTTNATSVSTASVVIAGGLGVAQDVRIGGNIFANNLTPDVIRSPSGIFTTAQVTSLAADTSTISNNALYVAGGVGVGTNLTVGGNTLIYGNLTVFGTQTVVTSTVADIGRKVLALSTSAGPAILSIDSGITVGPISNPFVKFLFDGVNTWKSTGNIGPVTSGAYSLGSISTPWAGLYSQIGRFSSSTPSTSPITGALTVTGGFGLGGDLYTSGLIRSTNLTTSSSTSTGAIVATGGLGIGNNAYIGGIVRIRSTTSATSTLTGALQVAGGAGFQGAVYATDFYNSRGEIYLTTATIAAYGVTRLAAGTDTSISTSTGIIEIWNTSNLQTITDRGASTNNIVTFANVTESTSTTTGAVIVEGGLAVKKSLYVGGDAVIYGNVTFTGTATNVLTTNTVFTDNLIELHRSTGSQWLSNDGKDIGIKIHYYDTSSKFGFFGRSNSSGFLEWISTGTESGASFTGTYGTFRTGVIRLVSGRAATSTLTGALIVQGGVGIGGDLYAYDVYSNGSKVLTAASIGSYGVSVLTAGTDTAVSDTTGDIVIWNTSTLQTITSRGSVTDQPITVNNTLTVSGKVIFQNSLTVTEKIVASSIELTNTVSATTGSFNLIETGRVSSTGDIITTSSNQYPVQILSNVDSTSSYYVRNSSTGSSAASSYVAENDEGNYIELGINGSNKSANLYGTGTAYLYVSTSTTSLNIGDSSNINFFTQNNTTYGLPTLSLDTTGTVTVVSDLIINDNNYENIPHATLTLSSNARVAYSRIRLENKTPSDEHIYTLDVGGSYRSGQNGAAVDEGNLTLYDDVVGAYRFIVAKTTGNILINKESDDQTNKLQVVGSFTATGVVTANTGTFENINVGIATVTGDLSLTRSLTVGTTATINGALIAHSTSTFDTTVKVGSSALETSLTPINTTDPTQIDSFDASLYRSARSVVQVTSGDDFHLAEIVLLHDNLGQVHKSEYGIILTNGALGEFSAVLDSGYVKLYFTAYNATTKTVNVVRTAIGV